EQNTSSSSFPLYQSSRAFYAACSRDAGQTACLLMLRRELRAAGSEAEPKHQKRDGTDTAGRTETKSFAHSYVAALI
ncbi:hypothetical protein ACC674_39535, partial [Rhizobium ruizarguesonis]